MWWTPGLALAAPWAPQPTGRFLSVSEVLLPREVWVNDEAGAFGFETRSWQLRLLARCTAEPGKGKRLEVGCTVDDAALQASAFPRTPDDDPAQVAAVLDAFVAHLRGASLHTTITESGRRTRWSVQGEPEGSGRATGVGRLVGRMLERALVPLWVERPRAELALGEQWVDSHAAVMSYPAEEGAKPLGTSQLLLQVSRAGERPVVDALGEGAMLDPVSNEQLRATLRARYELDDRGGMQQITWSLDATVLDTVRYHHAGWLQRLSDDAPAPSLGPTRQVRAPAVGPEGDLPGLPAWPELR
jgi:hypothetical protein